MKQSIHARRMARHHKRLKATSKLNLVSLMDIFTILVFFLLVNSSDVQVLQNNKSIELPASVADKKPDEALVVMVSADDIVVGGRKVANVQEVMALTGTDIPGLKKELDYLASRKPFRNEQEEEIGRNVTIMGDQSIPYALLKKIMTTCAKAEYRNIALAVSQVYDDAAPTTAAGG